MTEARLGKASSVGVAQTGSHGERLDYAVESCKDCRPEAESIAA
jgi:hypothetical protein